MHTCASKVANVFNGWQKHRHSLLCFPPSYATTSTLIRCKAPREAVASRTHWLLIAVWSCEVNGGLPFFCDWPAGRQPDSDWRAGTPIRCLRKKNEPIEAGTEVGGVGRRRRRGREAGREEVTGASQGLTQSDRLAGTNTQTHRAFMAGCSAEHTQCAACLRTRGKRNDR